MARGFDVGYATEPFATLCRDFPGPETYSRDRFRLEWGPIFHRGRLDGSARLLIVGQDPAQHETIVRRILVGEAGHRVQGFLGRLGLDTSYVMINSFLYSVYGSIDERDIVRPGIARYRNRWLDAIVAGGGIQASVTFGGPARRAIQAWQATRNGRRSRIPVESLRHPTFPESAGGDDLGRVAALTRDMLGEWSEASARLRRVVTPDRPRRFVRYGAAFRPADLVPVPAADLPAGLPAWMAGAQAWADRVGSTVGSKRATIQVRVPDAARWWADE